MSLACVSLAQQGQLAPGLPYSCGAWQLTPARPLFVSGLLLAGAIASAGVQTAVNTYTCRDAV